MQDIAEIIGQQRLFFATHNTKSVSFRITQLKKLKEALKAHEAEIITALATDLNRPANESYFSEIYLCIDEINQMIASLACWAKVKRIKTPWYLWPMKHLLQPEPYGVVFIISSWSYPIYLTIMPLIGAIAAGNCVIVKPSDRTKASASLLITLLNTLFLPQYIFAIQGDSEILSLVLKYRFDYIFLTGSAAYGRQVRAEPAQLLTPMTLELGGKSPCIVDETVDIDMTAKKIAWGKWLNAGQSCVAPDYLLVQEHIKEPLLKKLEQYASVFYGKWEQYCTIVDQAHLNHLALLLENLPIRFGGTIDVQRRSIVPTVVEVPHADHFLMREEIFGPILPVISYSDLNEAIEIINTHTDALVIYAFCHDKQRQEQIMHATRSGAIVFNDLVLPMSNNFLPFGGVGSSGMGRYHGKASFDSFSFYRTISTSGSYVGRWRYPLNKRLQSWMLKILKLLS